jgi:uncharacterized protein (TIGR03086 family)
MDTIDLLQQGFAFTRSRIVGVGGTPLDSRTPCDSWNLRQLVNHAVNAAGSAAGVLAGEDSTDPWSQSPGELADTDSGWPHPEVKYDEAANKILVACENGALDQLFSLRDMQLPGAFLARAVLFDSVVHGWDISRTSGQDATIPSAVADELVGQASMIPEEARGDVFGPVVDVPDGASASDRLVALLGRQP